ncbi:MAG: tetratricopeptide repeat protein [Deltaproteobacteria bacterium]|nr:tetratricopeptide repeat protein [Deltaproteobacteria bacterium]
MAKEPASERRRADTLIAQGRPAEAVPILRELVQSAPEEESLLLTLAWALHDSGRKEEAADCFERLLDRELSRGIFTGFAYDELVRLYREEMRWEKLLSVCERAVAAQPEDAGLLRTLGESYLAAEKSDAAAAVFEKLTVLETDVPGHWCGLGNARIAAGDPSGAEAAYLRAAELDPEDAPALFCRLADGCLRKGYPEQARPALLRCLALCPDEPLYRMALGDVLICLGKPDAAAETYAHAVALNPAAAGACWNRLGNGLAKAEQPLMAVEAFQKAVAAEPKNPRYLLRLAAAYAAAGLADASLAALRRMEAPCNSQGRCP